MKTAGKRIARRASRAAEVDRARPFLRVFCVVRDDLSVVFIVVFIVVLFPTRSWVAMETTIRTTIKTTKEDLGCGPVPR